MNKKFMLVAMGLGIGGIPFFAGATALFAFSKTPEYGWLQFGCGALFLSTAIAFWWMGRRTHSGI